MTKKRKKRKKPIAKPQFNLPNVAIIGLSVVIGFALFSIVDKVFYSEEKIAFKNKTDLSELLTISQYEKEYGNKITIQLLNGCGTTGIAEKFSNFLLDNGHDVVLKGNANHFGYNHSQIITRNTNTAAAKNIAGLLGISETQVRSEIDKFLQCDITLILGKDYENLKSFSDVLKINPTF